MPRISREPFWGNWTRTLPTPPRDWLAARWFWAAIAGAAVVIVGGATWVWALSGFSSFIPGPVPGLAPLSKSSSVTPAPTVTRRVVHAVLVPTPAAPAAPIFLRGPVIPGRPRVAILPGKIRIVPSIVPGAAITAPGKIISTTAPGSVVTAPGLRVTVAVPGPTVTVTRPSQPHPTITVTAPGQPGPTVTVAGPEQPGPTVTVTVPGPPGPTVTVPVPGPEITITVPGPAGSPGAP